MNAPGVRSRFRHLVVLAVATAALIDVELRGQVLDEPVKGFQVADHDNVTGKRKWVLSGDTAQNISNEELLLTSARMDFFDDKGSNNLVVVTPRCVYNTKVKQVTSPEGLKVTTGNGSFSIEGVGFDFQKSDSSLNISNQVHALVRKDLAASRSLLPGSTNPPAASPVGSADLEVVSNQVVHVFSDRFRFQTNLGVFRDHVRVNDPQGTLACSVLTIQFAESDRRSQQIERITAEQQVVVESGDTRATGDLGLYELAKDEVTLTGNPAWRLGPREGWGEELIFERKTKHFRALRNVRMRLPPGTLHPSGFLLVDQAAMAGAPPSSRRPVEVACDEFEFASGSPGTNASVTTCRGNVKVDDERGKLRCTVLTIESAVDNNRTERVVAERDVVVEQGDDRVACDRAIYFAPDERIEMTGSPTWRAGQREGRSDRLTFDLRNRTYGAAGGVHMRLPPGATGSSSWLLPAEAPLAEESVSPIKPLAVQAAQLVEIFSDDFNFKSAPAAVGMDEVVYRGHVRVRDPGRMSLDCGVMTGRMFPGASRMQTVVAEENVIIQANSPKGERIGRGDLAVYTAEREELVLTGEDGVDIRIRDETGESLARGKKIVYARGPDVAVLSGDPRLSSPKGVVTGDTVVLDHANSTLKATGHWKLKLKGESLKKAVPPALKLNPSKKTGPLPVES